MRLAAYTGVSSTADEGRQSLTTLVGLSGPGYWCYYQSTTSEV